MGPNFIALRRAQQKRGFGALDPRPACSDFDPFGARDDIECPPSAADSIENDGVMERCCSVLLRPVGVEPRFSAAGAPGLAATRPGAPLSTSS